MINNGLLDSNLLTKSLEWILSLKLLQLNRGILIQELINRKVSSSNSNFDAMVLDLDCYSLGSELVDSLRLTHEHDLEFRSLWVVVDELGQLLVSKVLLHWNVNSDSLLQVNDVLLKSLNLHLSVFKLLE